jgi:hypothetical protein
MSTRTPVLLLGVGRRFGQRLKESVRAVQD